MKKELLYIGILTLILVIGGCGTETEESADDKKIEEASTEKTTTGEETVVAEQPTDNEITGGGVVEETGTSEDATAKETTSTTESTVKEFTITAVKFGYTPSSITVRKGDTVHIIIDNADGMHGMRISELGISADEEVTFVAEKAGTFTWYCNNFCGSGHKDMSGTLVVEE